MKTISMFVPLILCLLTYCSGLETASAANTAGTPGTWLTPALGGSETPVHIAAGSDMEVDVNLDSDTVDATLVLYVTLDEV